MQTLPFVHWLASQGYSVATFNYRGMGDSHPAAASLQGFKADRFDGVRDTDNVIEALLAHAPGLPLYLVGHSLGAQPLGMLKHRDRIAGLVSGAAGSGHWRDNAPQFKRVALYFWHVLLPSMTALFGCFPGKRLGKVGNLPRGVIHQWRRWCLHPRYHLGAEGAALPTLFEAARFPVVALSITDDDRMTETGTPVLVDCYANAPRRIERIAPGDGQARRIGHCGFFRAQFQSTLWQRTAVPLHGFRPAKETT